MADFARFVQCAKALDRCAVMRAHGSMAWVCAGLGLLAVAAGLASLWPGGGVAAWPAGTLGILALAASSFRGDVRPRALGTICASTAVVMCTLELAGLWALDKVIS